MAEGMRGVRPWHGHCYNYRNYNDMHVFHASGVPPTRGSSILAHIGCTRKSKQELSKIVTL